MGDRYNVTGRKDYLDHEIRDIVVSKLIKQQSFAEIGKRYNTSRSAMIGLFNRRKAKIIRAELGDQFDERERRPSKFLWSFNPVPTPMWPGHLKNLGKSKTCGHGGCRLPRQPGKPWCAEHNRDWIVNTRNKAVYQFNVDTHEMERVS